jgi:hypothetical protein
MAYLGDYAEDYATLNFKFHTHKADGTPAALTSGAVSVYKGSATDSEVTTGVTLAANFDGVTGLNNVLIDLSSAAFYAVGFDYSVVITTGTVDSISVIGAVISTFSIMNRSKDVNVTTIAANAITATAIAADAITDAKVASDVTIASVTGAVGSIASGGIASTSFAANAITNAAVADDVDVNVKTITANAITATAINDNAITDAKVASDVTIASVTGAVGSVAGNVVGSVGSVSGAVGSVASGGIASTSFAAGAITAAAIANAAIDNATLAADIGSTAYATNIIALAVRKVLDELNLDHLAKTATAAADMTTEVADNTILSRLLANGNTSDFDPATDGLQLIRDAIAVSNPIGYYAGSNTETTKTVGSTEGDYSDTLVDDGVTTTTTTYYNTGPASGADGNGFGLDVQLGFTSALGRVPSSVTVNGRFNASSSARNVHVWAYDYTTTAFVQLSNTTTDFDGNATSNASQDQNRVYAMATNMINPATGAMIIRFTSTSTTTNDRLRIDFVEIRTVAQTQAGLTADAIQQAVWNRSHTGHDEDTLGYTLAHQFIMQGNVVSASDASTIVVDGDIIGDDSMMGALIMVEDKTDDHYEVRRIASCTASSNTVVVDRAFSFTPVAADDYYIIAAGYTEAMRGTDGAALATDWTATKAGYLTGAVALEATSQTLIGRLGAWTGTGINTVLGAIRALAAKANALTPTDISTGTTYDNTTDSAEAIKDATALEATLTAIKGAGWADETLVTIQSAAEAAGGGSGLTAQQTRDAMKLAPTSGTPNAGSIDAHLDATALEATLTEIKGAGWTDETLVTIQTAAESAGGGGGLTAQQTRDAMKLAPTAGTPAAGSVDAELDALTTAVADVPTNTEFTARTLAAADYVVTTDTIAGVTDKEGFTLSAAYDAAKTAAQPDEYDSQLTAISNKIVTVQADTDNIQTRIPAALVGGKMDSVADSMSDEAITAIAEAVVAATGALTEEDIPAIASAIKAELGDMDVTIISPVNAVGNISILRGATYTAATTQMIVTITDNSTFNVATDTPVINMDGVDFAATATEETPGTLIVTWDMTGAETLDLPLGRIPYSISWTRGAVTIPEIITGYATVEDIPGTVVVE